MELGGYFLALFMGATLGLLGGGGSILTVPILVYIFHITPVLATAYSLFVVGVVALVGMLGYLKQGLVNVKTGLAFAIPAFFSVFAVRRYLIPYLPDLIFKTGNYNFTKDMLVMFVFSVVMIMASVSMIRKGRNKEGHPTGKGGHYLLIGLEGLLVGGVTGFVGAGGGFLIVPSLVILVGLPIKTAIGTSLMIIAINSIIGFTGDLAADVLIDWHFLMIFTSLAVTGMISGIYAGRYVPSASLKPAFGWFVLVMGILILVKEMI